MKIKVFLITIIAIFSISVLYVSYFTNSPKEIKIGFVAGLSGKYSDLGTEERNGFMLAIEQLNESGGINHKKIIVDVRDDKQNEKSVVEAFEYFAQNDFQIVVGPATSSMAQAAMETINKYPRMTVFSPTASSKSFSSKKDNFIRFGNPNTQEKLIALAKHVKANVSNPQRALMVYDTSNESYAKKWSQDFSLAMQMLQANTDIVGLDLSLEIESQLKQNRVAIGEYDLVAMALDSKAVIAFSQLSKKIKPNMPLYAGGWALSNTLLQEKSDVLEGLSILTPFNPISQEPRYVEFEQAYDKRFGKKPGSFATRAYDTVMFIKTAIEKNPNLDKLSDTFTSIGLFKGLQADILIDEYGDPKGFSDLLITYQDGKFVQLGY